MFDQVRGCREKILLPAGPPAHFDTAEARTAPLADAALWEALEAAPSMDADAVKRTKPLRARVEYGAVVGGPKSFAALARDLGVMDNEKAGVPRGAYRGVVEFRLGPTQVLLAPALPQVRAYMAGEEYRRV